MSSIALFSSALFVNQTVCAVILLDNITGTTAYNTTGSAIQQYRSCSFTMGTQEYRLTNIQVALRFGAGTAASSQNTFEIRSGTTAGPSTTVIATFNPSPIDGTGYTTTAQLVTLTPAATVTLQPSTTYWVVMYTGDMTNFLMWPQTVTPSNAAPTSSVGITFNSCKNSTDNATWGSSSVKNSFQINGEIPLPPPTNAPIDLNFSKQVETFATEIEIK